MLAKLIVTFSIFIKAILTIDGNWVTKYVVEITTPGVQTPHKNPFKLDFFNDFGPDHLLPNGERMQFLLGNQMQVTYSEILNEKTKQRNLKIFSSPATSSQESASAHLIGIFPNFKNDKIVQGFELLKDPPYLPLTVDRLDSENALPHKQKPFDMEIDSYEEDFLFMTDVGKVCPKVEAKIGILRKFGIDRGDFEYVLIKLRGILRHIKFFGKEVQSLREHHLISLYETMRSHYYFYGKTYKGFSKYALKKLALVNGLSLMGRFLSHDKIRRIYNHHKMKKIITEFENAKKYPNYNAKFMLLSGTEINMMSLLTAFNKTSYKCLRKRVRDMNITESEDCRDPPKPASAMTIEFLYHTQRKEYYVRMMYNGYKLNICEEGTRSFCQYKVWKKLIQEKIMAENFFEICGNDRVTVVQEDRIRKEVSSSLLTVHILTVLFIVELLLGVSSTLK